MGCAGLPATPPILLVERPDGLHALVEAIDARRDRARSPLAHAEHDHAEHDEADGEEQVDEVAHVRFWLSKLRYWWAARPKATSYAPSTRTRRARVRPAHERG